MGPESRVRLQATETRGESAQTMTAEDTAQSGPDSVEQALERAREHARLAVTEAIRSLRALLDAVALAFESELDSESTSILAGIARRIDGLETLLAGASREDWQPLFDIVMGAVDGEIRRWEARATSDPNARTVLRAYLSFRELLWEVAMRGEKLGRTGSFATRGAARPDKR
jgi:hypothetical protein